MSTVIRHHPDGATLLSYAAATIAEPLAAVVAAHLSMCPRCRAEVADLELLGSAVMLSYPSRSAESALKAPARPADASRQNAQPIARSKDRLPGPIAAAYALSLDTITWKRLGPGVWHHRLALRQAGEGDLRLLRIAPGRKMPDHGHGGAELTLVIEGAYSDVTGQYRRGDIQDVDESIEHKPIVDAGGECVCLIASEHPARFKTLVGRLTQPWTRM
jgi:putative transcriptional regulator